MVVTEEPSQPNQFSSAVRKLKMYTDNIKKKSYTVNGEPRKLISGYSDKNPATLKRLQRCSQAWIIYAKACAAGRDCLCLPF